MIWSGWKIKENYHVLVNQFHGNFHSKTVSCKKIQSVFRDVKWCFNAMWGLKGMLVTIKYVTVYVRWAIWFGRIHIEVASATPISRWMEISLNKFIFVASLLHHVYIHGISHNSLILVISPFPAKLSCLNVHPQRQVDENYTCICLIWDQTFAKLYV